MTEHLVLCERCLNAFDIRDGGVELETPYRLTLPDRAGKMREVWEVGKCYVCLECLGPQGAKCQNVS